MPTRIEEAVLGERSGRHQADDLTLDHRLGAPLPRFGGILHLLADGDAMAEPDELLQVLVGGVDGHATHGNVLAVMLAAPGQRDAEGARGRFGIVEEQLVEVSHAVEQQKAGIGGLDLEILRHHGGGAQGFTVERRIAVSHELVPLTILRHAPEV